MMDEHAPLPICGLTNRVIYRSEEQAVQAASDYFEYYAKEPIQPMRFRVVDCPGCSGWHVKLLKNPGREIRE